MATNTGSGHVMTLLPCLLFPQGFLEASSASNPAEENTRKQRQNRDLRPFIHIRKRDAAVLNKFAVYTSAPPSNIHVSFLCFYHLGYARLSQPCALSLICQFQEHLAPRRSKTHPVLRVHNFAFYHLVTQTSRWIIWLTENNC